MRRAKVTWDLVFSEVHYFNQAEPLLSGLNTLFIKTDPPDEAPTIALMAEHASLTRSWTAILNADIMVMVDMLRIERILSYKYHADCALSRRFRTVHDQEPTDWGLDFFVARPEVWRAVAVQIPKVFRLGHIRWDTWLCSFWAHQYPQRFVDLTPSRLILHPDHDERGDQSIQEPDNYYLKTVRYPTRRVRVTA